MAVTLRNLRLYIFSSNMEARDPYGDGEGPKVLGECVPTDYDMYVVGLQESPGEGHHSDINAYLSKAGCVRLTGEDAVKKAKVSGRGDGSMVGKKSTTLAAWVKKEIAASVTIQSVFALGFGRKEGSKGAVAIVMRVCDTTLCVINCHLAANKLPKRQEQYKAVVDKLGNKLGNDFFQLNGQFHHVIWMGDMNFRLTNIEMKAAVELMKEGPTGFQTLHDKHDELSLELGRGNIYGGYKEAAKVWEEFSPTYKKDKYREADDREDPEWVSKTYNIDFQQQWYKGGRTKIRIPAWCDRVLYHSLNSTRNQLIPEDGVYGSITQQLMMSDHSPVYCGFNLAVKELPEMAVSVYKLRMFDATTSAGVTKVKHIKMVTPAPFEVVDRMPAAKKLPIEDISKGKAGKSWFFVGMAVGLSAMDPTLKHHALVKVTAENIKGECTVPLLLQDFVNGSTVEYTEELHYEGIMLRGPDGGPVTVTFKLEFIPPAGADEPEPES